MDQMSIWVLVMLMSGACGHAPPKWIAGPRHNAIVAPPPPPPPPQLQLPMLREPKSQTHRDVLFACGCGLVGVGLFPFLHAEYSRWVRGSDTTAFATNPVTHTAFDLVTCGFGGAFALIGVGLLFLSCLVLPPQATRACLKAVGVPLFVVAAGAATVVLAFYTDAEAAAGWRASAQWPIDGSRVATDERASERQVNEHVCRALGDSVCLDGSVRDAQTLFASLAAWPQVSDPDTPVASVCYEAAVAETELIVCRVCSRVTRGAASRRTETSGRLVHSLSRDDVRWCGAFLLTSQPAVQELDKVLYQQHRDEVVRTWRLRSEEEEEEEEEESVLRSLLETIRCVRLLLVLVWFSFPTLVVMACWYATAESADVEVWGGSVQ